MTSSARPALTLITGGAESITDSIAEPLRTNTGSAAARPNPLRATMTFRDSLHTDARMRTIAIGSEPLILIEPAYDADDMLTGYTVDCTDLDPEDVAALLSAIAASIRDSIAEGEIEATFLNEPGSTEP